MHKKYGILIHSQKYTEVKVYLLFPDLYRAPDERRATRWRLMDANDLRSRIVK